MRTSWWQYSRHGVGGHVGAQIRGRRLDPALMERRNARDYVGFLSAAQYHGTAHHRAQELQVVLEVNRPAIACGSVRVAFVARRNLGAVPVESFNNPRRTVLVSTVEATAVDLVGYMRRAGGVDRVAGILSELGEDMDPERLVEASRTAPIVWAWMAYEVSWVPGLARPSGSNREAGLQVADGGSGANGFRAADLVASGRAVDETATGLLSRHAVLLAR